MNTDTVSKDGSAWFHIAWLLEVFGGPTNTVSEDGSGWFNIAWLLEGSGGPGSETYTVGPHSISFHTWKDSDYDHIRNIILPGEFTNRDPDLVLILKGLRHFGCLKILDLSDCTGLAQFCNNFPYYEYLQSVDLSSTDVFTLECEVENVTFDKLKKLLLSNTRIANTTCFRQFPNLTALDLSHTQIKTIDGLEHLIELKVLNLGGVKTLEDPNFFATLSKLGSLEGLGFDMQKSMDLSEFPELPYLKKLFIKFLKNKKYSIRHIPILPQLETFNIPRNRLNFEDSCSTVERWPELIQIIDDNRSGTDLEHVYERYCKKYVRLQQTMTALLCCTHSEHEALPTLPNTVVELIATKIYDAYDFPDQREWPKPKF